MSATVLRPGLLDGVALLLAAADPPSRFGEAVIARAAELRAAVDRVVVDPTGDEVAPRAGSAPRAPSVEWSCCVTRC